MDGFCKIERQVNISSLYSFFIRECDKGFTFHGESHNFYEAVCVLHGSVGITAGTEVYTLCAGSAVIHPPMEFHSIRAAEGTTPTVLIFSFTADAFPALTQKTFAFTTAEEALLTDAWRAGRKAFARKDYNLKITEGNELYAQRTLEALSLFLVHILTDATDVHSKRPTADAQFYTGVAAYISENLPQLQSAPQIAAANGISTVGLQKLFNKYTGAGVMHYVNHLKITRAAEMLKNGSTSKAAALALGFADQNYFSTVFKRITGSSPTQYLKRN